MEVFEYIHKYVCQIIPLNKIFQRYIFTKYNGKKPYWDVVNINIKIEFKNVLDKGFYTVLC